MGIYYYLAELYRFSGVMHIKHLCDSSTADPEALLLGIPPVLEPVTAVSQYLNSLLRLQVLKGKTKKLDTFHLKMCSNTCGMNIN